jgi:hypothetical protein
LRSTLLAAIAIGLAGPISADETRTFLVTVDNKPAGQYQVKVGYMDGATDVTVIARVEFKLLLGTYRY